MDKVRQEDALLLERLRACAHLIGAPFGLAARSLEKTRRDARLFGSCDTDGNIRIRLRSRVTGRLLSYAGLVATLCHELAHLRHFGHDAAFVRLYRALLGFARANGLSGRGARARGPIAGAPARAGAVAASAPPRRRRADAARDRAERVRRGRRAE